MGVYIPNMEKPKQCYDCRLISSDGLYCRVTHEDVEWSKVNDDCPLIELEEWNSYSNGKMYAPKGTFQKILDDCEEDES